MLLCPCCGSDDTRVVDTRQARGKSGLRRRRVCECCGIRFATVEICIEDENPYLKGKEK